jgi:hypothetical protein
MRLRKKLPIFVLARNNPNPDDSEVILRVALIGISICTLQPNDCHIFSNPFFVLRTHIDRLTHTQVIFHHCRIPSIILRSTLGQSTNPSLDFVID